MYSFNNDYSEGACPAILDAMNKSNLEQSVGYGYDEICEQARASMQAQLHKDGCEIHFLVGGTQTNLTVIASILRPFEAVISADSGHINVHETGAIEATGHKVLLAEANNWKLTADGIRKAVEKHKDEHMVKPRMVYISNATEIGTIYTLQELESLREVCDAYGLYLYMDGARLAMALTALDNNVTMAKIAQLCDVFYIGGTKCGALFGEAVVIVNKSLQTDFRYMIKQRGGMLAKGRLLGIQFQTLFQNNLYFELAEHANQMAQKLQEGMRDLGINFLLETPTNQIFPVLSNDLIKKLSTNYQFQVWEDYNETQTIVRFVTSWATPEKAVDEFLFNLQKALEGEF